MTDTQTKNSLFLAALRAGEVKPHQICHHHHHHFCFCLIGLILYRSPQNQTFGICGAAFYRSDALSITQRTVSKHCQKLKALIPARENHPPFLIHHRTPEGRGIVPFHTGSSTPVCCYRMVEDRQQQQLLVSAYGHGSQADR